jgi:crossover junction endodeoxyribonuclease RuvC
MKILGIDPGSRITGYGIVNQNGNRLVHVDNGAIHTDCHKDFPLRLQKIYRALTEII